MNDLGIYIHVPFCGRKCPYCDFYSVPYSAGTVRDYTDAVLRNIRHYSEPERAVSTLYFGGGTPSLLTPEQLGSIISEVRKNFRLSGSAEITLEANPNTLTPEKLSILRNSGINRLSVGVQSLLDDELKMLGRTHSAERAEKAVRDAAAAGFGNISCDLMIALPGQTPEKLRRSAERLAALPVQHISAYILKAEEGTSFAESEFLKELPDDDLSAELYLETVRIMAENGFEQYEISNFAREGFESRHNCRYWKCQDYLGIGPAAHSCYGGKRFAVPRDIGQFTGQDFQTEEVTDDAPCGFEETAMLRLRLTEGIDLDDFPKHRRSIEKKAPALAEAGYVRFDGRKLSLTPEGFLVSNAVIGQLIF